MIRKGTHKGESTQNRDSKEIPDSTKYEINCVLNHVRRHLYKLLKEYVQISIQTLRPQLTWKKRHISLF